MEHSHAIGKRTHEHLEQRLAKVQISWADKGAEFHPTYLKDDDPLSAARGVTVTLLMAVPIWILFFGVLWAVGQR